MSIKSSNLWFNENQSIYALDVALNAEKLKKPYV